MEDTRLAALRRAQAKQEDRPAAEWQAWLAQMAMVRESAKFSGVEEWTRAHTIGALFACQAIRSSISMLRTLGQLNAVTAKLIEQACIEQETIAALMEQDVG